MCLNIGTPKTINFPFGTNEKLMVLGVPILKYFRVSIFLNKAFDWSYSLYTVALLLLKYTNCPKVVD